MRKRKRYNHTEYLQLNPVDAQFAEANEHTYTYRLDYRSKCNCADATQEKIGLEFSDPRRNTIKIMERIIPRI